MSRLPVGHHVSEPHSALVVVQYIQNVPVPIADIVVTVTDLRIVSVYMCSYI